MEDKKLVGVFAYNRQTAEAIIQVMGTDPEVRYIPYRIGDGLGGIPLSAALVIVPEYDSETYQKMVEDYINCDVRLRLGRKQGWVTVVRGTQTTVISGC